MLELEEKFVMKLRVCMGALFLESLASNKGACGTEDPRYSQRLICEYKLKIR